MTISFKNYILNYSTINIDEFKTIDCIDLNLLPKKPCSSKVITSILKNQNISNKDLKKFNQVYMEYFRYYMIKEII